MDAPKPPPTAIERLIADVQVLHGFDLRRFVEHVVQRYGIEGGDPMTGKPQPTGEPHDPDARGWMWRHLPAGGVLPVADAIASSDAAVQWPRTQAEALAAVLGHCWAATQDAEAVAVLRTVQQRIRDLESQREAFEAQQQALRTELVGAKRWLAKVDAEVELATGIAIDDSVYEVTGSDADAEDDESLRELGAGVLKDYAALVKRLQRFEHEVRYRTPSWAGLPGGPHRGEDTLITVCRRLCYVAGLEVKTIAELLDDGSGEDKRERHVRDSLGSLKHWKPHRLKS